jgi:hypothetical protein
MLDQVSGVNDVIACLKEVDQRVILQAIFNGSCAVLGSAVALEVKYAQAGKEAIQPWTPESEGDELEAVEVREVDTSSFDARMNAIHWIIANTGAPDRVVRPQLENACKWLRTAQDNDETDADGLKALADLGMDAETIEKGRVAGERWKKARSERKLAQKAEILDSIGSRTIDDVCNVVDAVDLAVYELSLVIQWFGNAVHKAEIDAVAIVYAGSWSKRRKAEAISDAAALTGVRDMLDAIEVPDTRDLVSTERHIW